MQNAQKHDRRNTESNIHDNAGRLFALSRHSLKSDNSAHVCKGREVNEMADFFMKCPPPVSHATAQGLSDNEKRSTNIRHSALRMFGRYKKKKSTASEPLQHLESAVSSKTRSGSKHMAISVSKEDNFCAVNSECNLPQTLISECGSVTVLKPVSEFGELHRFSQGHHRDSAQSSRAEDRQEFSIHGPLIEEYQPNYKVQPKRRRETGASISTVRSIKYPVCTQTNKRQDGHQSPGMDSIHSRSSLSLLSLATSRTCNSPDASTSRGTSPDSSYYPYSYRSHSSLERHAQTSELVSPYGPIPSTPKKAGEAPSASPLVFGTGTAKLARSFSGAGVEKAHIVRCSTPNLLPGPAPTSRLPNLSASRSTLSLPAQSSNESSQIISEVKDVKRPGSHKASTLHGRHQNFKTREAQAQGPSNQFPGISLMCDSSTQCVQQDIQPSPQLISLSSIITVADLPPDDVCLINNASTHTRKKRSRKWSSTPDLSAVAAQNALNDQNRNSGIQMECRLNKHSGSNPLRLRDVSTGSRRQERRPRAQLPKDRDLDSRICKMERDNATLLSALNGIVRKFGELNGLGTTLSLEEKKDVALKGLMSTEFTWSVEKAETQFE
ncbi:Bgt-5475 [Blumeria graminis f. sp. tritici]|uniref:Bgt-5475 n=2 Tax=Blumeria graminis f. sp. tritici TaxID=62690 RepID=A0A381L364_BLUGR|nr:hypothetical protein BGT96224_5475 [Blumeria graminis f. sp. tritici 96224]VDB88178.1 Bgt-5475 [Blumeria graminis f. sp. tritici]